MKENRKSFLVKDGSINEFFKGAQISDNRGNFTSPSERDFNPYSLMRDNIILPIEKIDTVKPDIVVFELKDSGRMSGKELINTYTYEVLGYDDVCFNLKLIDFKVNLV